MTTTVSSIGTSSRDYSTIAAWEAAAPADLVSSTTIWKGECYNDSEFTVTSTITLSGSTSNSSYYKWLTAATGQSFADHANKLTNALTYNQTKGVGVITTTAYVGVISLAENYALVDRLQIKQNNSAEASAIACTATATTDKCIIDATSIVVTISSAALTLTNSVLIKRNTPYKAIACNYSGVSTIRNCTIVTTGATGNGFTSTGGATSTIIKNCAVLGFTSTFAGTYSASSGYNATDAASAPGSNNQTSLTYASQFQNVTAGASDFRALSTGSLKNGTPDTTYTGGLDIVGQTRDATTPYIGCWEVVSAAVFKAIFNNPILQAVKRAGYF